MENIQVTYYILKGKDSVFESSVDVKLTQKQLTETETFIREHDFSPEFEDVPGAVYDKCGNVAFEAALKAYPKIADEDEELEVVLEQHIPVSLLMLLSDDVKRKMLTDDPYDMDESEIFGGVEDPEVSAPAAGPVEAVPVADEEDELPCKENTLYLPIKQVYFDQIVEGTKKEEYRDIKDTTYKKYLECDEEGNPYMDANLVDEDDPLFGDIYIWNNGVYPFFANQNYLYLHLAVGYNKERDEALVEIEDMTFRPLPDNQGNPCRFTVKDGEVKVCADGELCFWQVVFHLGKAVEVHRK